MTYRSLGATSCLVFSVFWFIFFFFFFQAEDGIRDHCVTGVQTCALPISDRPGRVHHAEGDSLRHPDLLRGVREQRQRRGIEPAEGEACGEDERDEQRGPFGRRERQRDERDRKSVV